MASVYSSYREQAEKLIDKAFFDEFMKGLNDGNTPNKLPEAQKLKGYNELQKSLDALLKSSFGSILSVAKSELMYAYVKAFVDDAVKLGLSKADAEKRAKAMAASALDRPGADGKNYVALLNSEQARLSATITSLLRDMYFGDGNAQISYGKIKLALEEGEKRIGSLYAVEPERFGGWGGIDAHKVTGTQSYVFVAVMDERTTGACKSLNGKVFPINAAVPGVNYPPLHYGCRSAAVYSHNGAESFSKELDRANREKGYLDRVLEQLVFGNYTDEFTLGGAIAEIVNGFIPFWGLAADIRDIAYNLQQIENSGLSGRTIFDLTLSAAALVPGAGDALKAIGKGVEKGLAEAALKAAKVLKATGKKIPADKYDEILKSSLKNPNAKTMTLGKYDDGGSASYIARAGKDSSYFDMGDNWAKVQAEWGLSEAEMFEYFNVPALDDAIKNGKVIRFSHDPRQAEGFLLDEWKYIKEISGLTDANLIFEGGFWIVK